MDEMEDSQILFAKSSWCNHGGYVRDLQIVVRTSKIVARICSGWFLKSKPAVNNFMICNANTTLYSAKWFIFLSWALYYRITSYLIWWNSSWHWNGKRVRNCWFGGCCSKWHKYCRTATAAVFWNQLSE